VGLRSDTFFWEVGYVGGVQLFIGCARSRMGKKSLTSMPDIAIKASLSRPN